MREAVALPCFCFPTPWSQGALTVRDCEVPHVGKNKKKGKAAQPPRPATTVTDGIFTLLPAALVLGLRTVAAPCVHADGSVAACTTAGHVLFGLAVAALALALMRLLGADLRTRRSFDLLLVLAGIAIALLPGTTLSLCADAAMPCRAIMRPFARVMGVALVVGALACELTVDHEVPTGRKRR